MSLPFDTPEQTAQQYATWLESQPLSPNTRRTYRTQARQYCDFLKTYPDKYGEPLRDPKARDYAVRDYKTYLLKNRRLKPTTVNLALAVIDHFYRFLGMGEAQVQREELPQQAPRALEPQEQVDFLRAVERCESVRDRAIAILLFYTGLRVGECVEVTVDDVGISARKGVVKVRSGKGNTYREVPLNAQVRQAVSSWLIERKKQHPETKEQALFLNRQGEQLSTRGIDLIVRQLGKEARLTLSAHVLRHTCLTNLVRNGIDLVLVAEIAGHKRLETTRRYSLPTARDRAEAMENIQVDY